jgi:hypothetical protein
MSNLTAYLREHGMVGVETLKNKWAIKATPHKKHSNLLCFSYSQINSPFEEPLIKECRGLVLDAHDNFNVVAFPYVKFFNEKYAIRCS